MEEAGAALAGALGGLRTILAGVVPPASGTRTQLAESDPTEEPPAPLPAEVELNVETAAAETVAVETVAAETAAAETLAEEKAEVEVKVEGPAPPAPSRPAPLSRLASLVGATECLKMERSHSNGQTLEVYVPWSISFLAVCSTDVCDKELWMLARHDCSSPDSSFQAKPQYKWKRPSEPSSVPSGRSL